MPAENRIAAAHLAVNWPVRTQLPKQLRYSICLRVNTPKTRPLTGDLDTF